MGRRLATGVGAAVAVLAAGGGVAVLTWPSGAAPASLPASVASVSPAPPAAPPPDDVRTTIDEVDLAPLAKSFTLPQRDTKAFSMLSVSWKSPREKPTGTVQVRTRSARTGIWTGWQSLSIAEPAADGAEQAKVRGRTEPLWAGPSNGVAARLVGAGAKPLPSGLRLNLINPDAVKGTGGAGGGVLPGKVPPTSTAPTGAPPAGDPDGTDPEDDDTTTLAPPPAPTTTSTTPAPTTTTTTATTPPPSKPSGPAAPMPAYTSRAGWGANEKLVKAPATIAAEGVKMVWVHHTATKDAACAQSASVVRAIMGNDVNEGFDDMGYNFLVDKCGAVFEGRKGSVTAAVVGAHVAGFNTGTAGIALLGDYTTVKPTQIALTKIAAIAASRLRAYGFDPSTTTEMTEGVSGGKFPIGTKVTFPRISGHRDGAQTECPGAQLYPLLSVIRARALLSGLKITTLTGGPLVSATGSYYVRTTARLFWDVTGDLPGVERYDVLLDNKVATTVYGNVERAANVTVPAGAHTLAVRVVHKSGAADVTSSIKVFGDVTKPAFPAAPSITLRTGTYSDTAVPVTSTFRSADNVKVFSQRVTSPAAVALGGTSTVWYPTVKPGAALKYTVAARDWAGNEGTVTTTRTVINMPETSAKRTGTWSNRAASTYLGGKALAATAKNAKLAYTFTGRAAALTFTRTAATGVAYVYVDGVKVATVDTRATKTTSKQTLWVRTLTAKAHTVSVLVAGTAGRPTVISDGLTYIP